MSESTDPLTIELSGRPSNLTDVIAEALKKSTDIETELTFFSTAEHPVNMQLAHHALPFDRSGIPLTLTLSAVDDNRYDPEITEDFVNDIDPDLARTEFSLTDQLAIHTTTVPEVGIGYSRLINGVIVKTVTMPTSRAGVTEIIRAVDEWINRCPVNAADAENSTDRWSSQARLSERTHRTLTWHGTTVLSPAAATGDTGTVETVTNMSLADHREYETDTTLGDLNNTVVGLDIDPFSVPGITEAANNGCPDIIIGERIADYFRTHNPGLSVTVYTGPLSH